MRRQAAKRYTSWVLMLVSSFVVLLSVGQEFLDVKWSKGIFVSTYDQSDVNTSHTQSTLILVVCGLSLLFSLLVVISKARPALRLRFFRNNRIEVLVSVTLCVLWIVALVIIQAPKNRLAVQHSCHATVIRNTNLYFSSWVALLATVYNVMEILEEHKVTNVKLMVDMMPKEIFSWTLQFVVGLILIVFSTTTNTFDMSCSSDCTYCLQEVGDSLKTNCYSKRMCWSAYFAVGIAAISTFISMAAISTATRGIISPTADIILGSISMFFHLSGIVVLTSIGGPSFSAGNSYFLLWIGFLNTLRITTVACYEYTNEREKRKDESTRNVIFF